MKSNNIIIAGIAGTTAFTLFSYLISKGLGKNFKEPALIGKMVERSIPALDERESAFTGWLSHYLIGVAFAAAFEEIIEVTGIKPTISNGIITGALSGFPAALTWDSALKLHPAPPRGRSLLYYSQLLVGHAIFGGVCFWVLNLFEKDKYKNRVLSANLKLQEE